MSLSHAQAAYGHVYRSAVAGVRALAPHHWPVVGTALGRAADRIMSHTHPSVVFIDGEELRLDPRDDLGVARGRPFEPLLRQTMRSCIPQGGTVVDGGAHIGYHTLLASRLVGSSGLVFAFEPAPANFALLVDNLARNKRDNVTAVNAALSDGSGKGSLVVSEVSSGRHHTVARPEEATILVDLYSLDDFLTAHERVDFLKLDVQGAEPHALRGARRVLDRNPQLVASVEFEPISLPEDGGPELLLEELFARFDRVFDVNDETKEIVPADRGRLLRSYTRANRRHTNLLCLNRDLDLAASPRTSSQKE